MALESNNSLHTSHLLSGKYLKLWKHWMMRKAFLGQHFSLLPVSALSTVGEPGGMRPFLLRPQATQSYFIPGWQSSSCKYVYSHSSNEHFTTLKNSLKWNLDSKTLSAKQTHLDYSQSFLYSSYFWSTHIKHHTHDRKPPPCKSVWGEAWAERHRQQRALLKNHQCPWEIIDHTCQLISKARSILAEV